jgi:hypothetical protein
MVGNSRTGCHSRAEDGAVVNWPYYQRHDRFGADRRGLATVPGALQP